MIRLIIAAVLAASVAACIDQGPPVYELDSSWTSTAHTTRGIADDRVSVVVMVKDANGLVRQVDGGDAWQRVPGYDGSYAFQLATDSPTVQICATLEYVEHGETEPPPWCSGSECEPQPEDQHWGLGDQVCTEVALTSPTSSTALSLSVWN